jgi:hypothetical protein
LTVVFIFQEEKDRRKWENLCPYGGSFKYNLDKWSFTSKNKNSASISHISNSHPVSIPRPRVSDKPNALQIIKIELLLKPK